MNVRKALVIAGLLAAFTTTSAFAYNSTYNYHLNRGASSISTGLVTKDDNDQNAYVTATSNSNWLEGQEGYNVRVRDSSGNPMMDFITIYSAGSYTLSYDYGTGYANHGYRLYLNYDESQPYSGCEATGRWCP